MKRELWAIVAIALIAIAVVTAVVFSGLVNKSGVSSETSSNELSDLSNVQVVATGPSNLTSYGYTAVLLNVTNYGTKQLNMSALQFTVTLADGTTLDSNWVGPNYVLPSQTKEFLVVSSIPGSINITIVNLVMGDHWVNCAVPTKGSSPDPGPINPPDPSTLPIPTTPTQANPAKKDEPRVMCSLLDSRPFSPIGNGYNRPFYGEPCMGEIATWVEEQADASHIGIVIYFVGIHANQVFVNSSFNGGPQVWTNIYNDGNKGCYGLLLDDPSAISGDMGWTWMYSGSSKTEYHNISISVTTYALGAHEVRLYAYDQDTGELLSDVETYSITVYGSGGKYNPYYMFDTSMSNDLSYPFTPGQMYNFSFEDSCKYPRYAGEVRSTFVCPYAENVWLVGEDGTRILLAMDGYGYYTFSWQHVGGVTSHFVHLEVQLGKVSGGPYPWSMGYYWVSDGSTGLVMSQVNGMSWAGKGFELGGPMSE